MSVRAPTDGTRRDPDPVHWLRRHVVVGMACRGVEPKQSWLMPCRDTSLSAYPEQLGSLRRTTDSQTYLKPHGIAKGTEPVVLSCCHPTRLPAPSSYACFWATGLVVVSCWFISTVELDENIWAKLASVICLGNGIELCPWTFQMTFAASECAT
ncbi:hypothetical protein N657DRAFT_643282 [Parathielavia appendiculata]|uniref:Uncharacterized protein n=1 Tax=Parathielavia appendiculata TaxID=2587402 RepID=A0AAN6U5R9_9PEZI|nr:hypothetical protein N657DRAFT_643282 [Parathielavia appendiculata]